MDDILIKTTKPSIVEGGIFSDARGNISHVNSFNFNEVKRFYTIHHPDLSVIRAWQGHQFETKYFYVIQGAFTVAWVEIDNWKNPSQNLKADSIALTADNSRILIIPPGYANGIKALLNDSKIIVFCNFALQESLDEKIRFDSNLWFDWSSV